MAGRRVVLTRVASALTIAVGAAGLLFATSTAAGAQGSTTPPVSPVPTSCSSSTTITLVVSGTAVQVSLGETCAFAPNSPVAVSFLGGTVANVTSDASGLVTLTFSGEDPHLSVNNGTYQSAIYGVNTFVATGTNASGATNTATFLVDLEQPAGSAPSAATSANGLAFTGADLAALAAAALALIVLGAGVVLYSRRRPSDIELDLPTSD